MQSGASRLVDTPDSSSAASAVRLRDPGGLRSPNSHAGRRPTNDGWLRRCAPEPGIIAPSMRDLRTLSYDLLPPDFTDSFPVLNGAVASAAPPTDASTTFPRSLDVAQG